MEKCQSMPPGSLRVAVADDDLEMRECLQKMLCDLGHEVVAVAENGELLIDLCATTQPDVVITGTLTPQMHGADAAAHIYKSRPIPIILYSRHCEPDLSATPNRSTCGCISSSRFASNTCRRH